jgi:alkylation response protein AidB-like acyl-CoA dehydrogenase
MSIAITEEHQELARTASDFLARNAARGAARALLESESEGMPDFWGDMARLGWLGLHLPEALGGSGAGIPELVVVVEELGRAVAPGPFVPSVIASAAIAAAGTPQLRERLLPGLADGSRVAAVGLGGSVSVRRGRAHGPAGAVLCGGLADVLLLAAGDDAVLVEASAEGVEVKVPANLDPTRRAARVVLDGAPAEVLSGSRRVLVDLARTILSAEAAGVARECAQAASEYAKVREQFGRPIGTFQAVKHHCANMLVSAEVATSSAWDAARAAESGGEQLSYAAAAAAALAVPAAAGNAQMSIQVHGGIGFTWEHDAHLYLRRASGIGAVIDADEAAAELTDLARKGVRRARQVELPAEAEPIREEVRRFAERVRELDADAKRDALIESGYAMPHWPRPWGREAGAVEQLVIEQELDRAGIKRPAYAITGWVILTLIQHATADQVARWVPPAMRQEVVWCQLFSEPDAGSDAAGIKTRGTRVEGGWLVNGQKVWTSGAQVSKYGFATVRTNPDVPKHEGITTMVIDMQAEGVEVRPLRMLTGSSDFNEVFFNDVLVPDDDVVGPVDGGWTVARATLGNESVSIGGGQGGMAVPAASIIGAFDASPDRLPGGAARVGRYVASTEAIDVLNLRAAHRAVAGGGPGPEGNLTKLLLSENGHEASAILAALAGPELAFLDGAGAMAGMLVLMNRALSIAGGTSEIKRNQIAERILGLPRDPLIR